jgi:hypothetical protein
MLTPMPDESDPPRKFYQLKPKEFDRVNAAPAPPPDPAASASAHPRAAAIPDAVGQRIDARDLSRQAMGTAPLLGVNAPVNRPNEVHDMLRENLAVEGAAGLHDLKPLGPKRSRRRRDFWMLTIGTNAVIAIVYAAQMFVGFQVMCLAANMPAEFGNLVRFAISNPATYILAVAAMIFFTVAWAWLLFGVMDDY